MSKEVWKSFEDNEITHSGAHYLMTIKNLLEHMGYARVTDIARRLNITRGSCSISLKPLKRRGLVVEDENRFLLLSDEGKRIAEMVEMNDQIIESFLKNVLGVETEQAEVDACKIEHLVSIETSLRLRAFLHAWEKNPAAARKLRETMASDTPSCSHDTANCEVCNKICLVDIPALKTKKP